MATEVASLYGKIGVNLSGAERGLARFGTMMENAGRKLNVFGSLAGQLTAAAALTGAGAMVKLGMDAVETANLYRTSMGQMADAGQRWIDQMNKAYGLNKVALQQNLGMFNQWFSNMGFGTQTAYDMSTALTKLAYDFSSFYNVGADEAFTRIQSAMSGEMEAVRRWGIDVSDAAVKTYALKNGLADQNAELSQSQKAWIRYALLLQQSSAAQGDLARTMDSPANQLRLMRERAIGLATDFGMKLLPTVSGAMRIISEEVLPRANAAVNQLSDEWVSMSEVAKGRILAISALLLGSGPLIRAVGVTIVGLKYLARGFAALATAATGKIGLIVMAVTILARAIYDVMGEQLGAAIAMVGSQVTVVARSMLESASGPLGDFPWLRDAGMKLAQFGNTVVNAGEGLRELRQNFNGAQLMGKLLGDVVDDGTAAFDDLTGSVANLGEGVLEDAVAKFDEWAGVTQKVAKGMGDLKVAEALNPTFTPPTIDPNAFNAMNDGLDGVKKKAKDAGISVSDLTQALVANSAITRTAAVAVTYWESQIESTNLAIEANRDQLQAAQADLQGMQDHLSSLNDELSEAKRRFDEFTHPTLTGMTALDDQIFAAEQAIKRLQLQELDWQIGGGVGDSPFKAQIEAAQRDLQRLQLEQSITFDPQMRSLDKLANPQTEMTYEQAAQGIKEWGARVAELTKAVEVQEKAIKSQEEVVKSIQAAADALNKTLAYQQEQLELAKANFENVTKALTAAFTWFLTDREEIRKMGPAGVEASDQVDEATKALLLGLTGFAADNTTQSQKNIAQMVADYEAAVARIKAMLNGVGGPGVPSIGAATGGGDQFRAIVNGKVVYDGPNQNAAENAYNNAGGGAFGDGNIVEKHDYPGPAYAGVPYRIGTQEIFTPATNGYITPLGGASVNAGGQSITININGGTYLGNSSDVARKLYRLIEPEIRRNAPYRMGV